MSVHDPDLDGAGPKPKPGFIWFTRHRWDVIFLPSVLVSIGLTAAWAWKMGSGQSLVALILGNAMLGAFWLVCRRSTPPEGHLAPTISGSPGQIQLLALTFSTIILLIAGMLLIGLWFPFSGKGEPMTRGDRLLFALVACLTVVFLAGAQLIRRRSMLP